MRGKIMRVTTRAGSVSAGFLDVCASRKYIFQHQNLTVNLMYMLNLSSIYNSYRRRIDEAMAIDGRAFSFSQPGTAATGQYDLWPERYHGRGEGQSPQDGSSFALRAVVPSNGALSSSSSSSDSPNEGTVLV